MSSKATSSSPTEQQQAILVAARDLLAAGGPEALRVRDIATAAGCTTMAVYSRFGGKDGVLDALYVDGFRRFTKALEGHVDRRGGREGDGEQSHAIGLGLAYRAWAIANPGIYQVMFTEAVPGFTPSEESAEVAMGSFQVLVDAIEVEQQAARLRSGDAVEIAWALWGMSHGLVMLELAGVRPTGENVHAATVYEASLAAIWRGFAPGSAG